MRRGRGRPRKFGSDTLFPYRSDFKYPEPEKI